MADDACRREPAVTPRLSPADERTTATDGSRPRPLQTSSTARSSSHSLNSPLRHRTRHPTFPRKVKETLNARSEYTNSEDDGTAEHRINQYLIKQEIGRGSFGAVHLAVDQYGQEYAVKEFSKSRLRKRAQSQLLRNRSGPRRPGARAASTGFNEPLHRNPSSHNLEEGNSLHLIRQEIAIMKKLNHPNLVSLYEVLDDPTEDSLYMVMEMCKKGVVMKVGLGEESDPYDDEHCRCWFRDLILGIEYLHAQGIAHRDIKPDNCLLTSDDVLKIVDFGVSEMFEKDSDMYTAKSAGSPAFLPPELCVARHGDVSGRAADIWSMGVTLYCLRYGRIPFEMGSIFELYSAIRSNEVVCPGETDENFKDLISRILEKDPKKRITMAELREHPWVTKDGTDMLLSAEENTADLVEAPTEEEMNTAITKNISHAITVVKAVQKFKRLIEPSSPRPMQSILGEGEESHFVQPPLSINESGAYDLSRDRKKHKSEASIQTRSSETVRGIDSPHVDASSTPDSTTADNTKSRPSAFALLAENPSRTTSRSRVPGLTTVDTPPCQSSEIGTPSKGSMYDGTRGHARDPLEEEHPYLYIGPSSFSTHTAPDPPPDGEEDLPPVDINSTPIVSESPSAADIDIYETAYREEIERIRNRTRTSHFPAPKVYLTRRVDGGKSNLAALLEEAKVEGTLLTPRAASHPRRPPTHRTASALAAAVSSLRASSRRRTPASPGPEHEEEPAEPLAATVTTAVAAEAEIATSPTQGQPQSELRKLLNRMKDKS